MESTLYGIYALVVFVSEIERVTFLIRQNLMRKYRTPALSIFKWVFSIAELSQDLKPDFTKAPQSSLL